MQRSGEGKGEQGGQCGWSTGMGGTGSGKGQRGQRDQEVQCDLTLTQPYPAGKDLWCLVWVRWAATESS